MDRLKESRQELDRYHIPFRVWKASKAASGREGLRATLIDLLWHALNQKQGRILIFEDDVRFINDPNTYMPACMEQILKIKTWDLFYLGVNTHIHFKEKVDENLLKLKYGYALHAVAYSTTGMIRSLDALNKMGDVAADVAIEKIVQPLENCYCSFPMLATQRPSYSDIEHKNVDYDFLVSRFNHHSAHLK